MFLLFSFFRVYRFLFPLPLFLLTKDDFFLPFYHLEIFHTCASFLCISQSVPLCRCFVIPLTNLLKGILFSLFYYCKQYCKKKKKKSLPQTFCMNASCSVEFRDKNWVCMSNFSEFSKCQIVLSVCCTNLHCHSLDMGVSNSPCFIKLLYFGQFDKWK